MTARQRANDPALWSHSSAADFTFEHLTLWGNSKYKKTAGKRAAKSTLRCPSNDTRISGPSGNRNGDTGSREAIMVLCPECETDLDIEEDELDEGEIVSCLECGTDFEVVATNPLELNKVKDDEDEEDEDEKDE
jgi:alpha-aminoadipate carrier protein LysW